MNRMRKNIVSQFCSLANIASTSAGIYGCWVIVIASIKAEANIYYANDDKQSQRKLFCWFAYSVS